MKKILFVTSEAFPLIKTGGLADVSGSLPIALRALGHDVRILIPDYASILSDQDFKPARNLGNSDAGITILEGVLPGSEVPVWGLSHKGFFGRKGNPYLDDEGHPWPDNADRFSLLCHVGVDMAMDRLGLDWKPDIVHCNDWQTGLIPALLSDEIRRPAVVFTIHNLAYQGVFPRETFTRLRLPSRLWSLQALEFYDQFSFIKGGLVFADRISTVSPTYAREIQGKEFGCGLEGVLGHRRDRLTGILNGIDAEAWNPATDPHLPSHFDARTIEKRGELKRRLQERFGLQQSPSIPLLAGVGRLVEQKGIDLLIDILPWLAEKNLQMALIGTGNPRYERTLRQWSRLFPERIAIHTGYDEARAHLVEAGADIFLMPSRFEPCGLNQMYSQRYGAVPLVRRVGGLADTVLDANPVTLAQGVATGIVFNEATPEALLEAIERALNLYQDPSNWHSLQSAGMSKDFSWETSARQYLGLYEMALHDCMQTDSPAWRSQRFA